MVRCMSIFKKMQISFRIIRKGFIVCHAIMNGLKDPVSGIFYLRMLRTLNTMKANCLVFCFALNTGDIFSFVCFVFPIIWAQISWSLQVSEQKFLTHLKRIAGVFRDATSYTVVSFFFEGNILKTSPDHKRHGKYFHRNYRIRLKSWSPHDFGEISSLLQAVFRDDRL